MIGLLPGKSLAESKNTLMPDDLVSIFPEALGCNLGANINFMDSLYSKQNVAGKQWNSYSRIRRGYIPLFWWRCAVQQLQRTHLYNCSPANIFSDWRDFYSTTMSLEKAIKGEVCPKIWCRLSSTRKPKLSPYICTLPSVSFHLHFQG